MHSTKPPKTTATGSRILTRLNGRQALRKALAPLLIFVLASNIITAYAREDPPKPEFTSEQQAKIKQLEAEIELLKLKQAKEALEKQIRDAQFNPSVSAPEGKITLNNVAIETEVMSYMAMSEVVDDISKEIFKNFGGATAIAIYNSKEVKDWRFYQAVFPVFSNQMNKLIREYKNILGQEETERLARLSILENEILALDAAGRTRTSGQGAFKDSPLEGVRAGLFDISATARSFLDLMSLFRTETTITGNPVTVDESALVSELVRHLAKMYNGKAKFYNPAAMSPQFNLSSPTTTINMVKNGTDLRIDAEKSVVGFDLLSTLLAEKKALLEKVEQALTSGKAQIKTNEAAISTNDSMIKQLQAKLAHTSIPEVKKKLREEIAALEKENQGLRAKNTELAEAKALNEQRKTELTAAISIAEQAVAIHRPQAVQLRSLNQQFDKLLGDFAKLDVTTGVNPLAVFVKAENIEEALRGSQGYWLAVRAVKAGGNNRTRRNLIRYFSGAKVDHSGGVIIEYALYDKSGAIVYSDKFARYDRYKEPKEITKFVDP